MDVIDVEENIFTASDAKLHGEMCKTLSAIYCRIMSIFPSLEAARPRSKSGIQALCALHVALEKSKTILLHCSECSKLYLAITGDSVLLKFDKTRSALEDSLRRVEDIVPQSIGCQIQEIVGDLEGTVFSVDPLEKQAGDEIIALLQQGSKFDNCNDTNELESFHQAAVKLGITSSRAALSERRALKKLIERARAEEDKRKESIVAYLLHLMRKYSKLFRSEFSDDTDSQGSAPCSPTVLGSVDIVGPGGNGHAFDRQLSKLSSFNFKPSNKKSDQMPLPPEELRCPISLQLMYDPVIIASGQTYERICIEKWFNDGHRNCPKTRQKLSHLSLTPNYCVKGLVSSWCEQNGVVIPYGPPESLDLNYWRLVLSECDSSNSKSVGSNGSCNKLSNSVKVVSLEERGALRETDVNGFPPEEGPGIDEFETYDDFLTVLSKGDLMTKCKTVEKIRLFLKDDEEARIYMGANGFVQALMQFLDSAVRAENAAAQESAAMALFNLAVNNNRNKETMMSLGIIPLLEEMTSSTYSHGFATALYLNLSCLDEAKPIIGSSSYAVAFLSGLLQKESNTETETQCKLDALHTLYNLSSVHTNAPYLLSSGIVPALQSLLASLDRSWTEKCLAVLLNLASTRTGKDEMVSCSSSPGLIGALATVLDSGEPAEQEQAVSCLLVLCRGSDKCSLMVLQEGVIPGLVSISVNGTSRGKEKAQKLLMLFREQRQRDHQSASALSSSSSSPEDEEMDSRNSSSEMVVSADGSESKPFCKSVSRRKMGKAFSFLWKRTYSVSQC